MTKREIVEILARDQRVETMVKNIAHSDMTPDLEDLSQMVYVILMDYDEDKILDLWDHGQINFFIARIILNQYRSSHSAFHDLIRKPRELSDPLGGHDRPDQ